MWYSGMLWAPSDSTMPHEAVYIFLSILLPVCLVWVYYVLVCVAKQPTPAFKWRLRILLGVLALPSVWRFFPSVGPGMAVVQGVGFAKILILLGVVLFCFATGIAYLGFQLSRLVRYSISRRRAASASASAEKTVASAGAVQAAAPHVATAETVAALPAPAEFAPPAPAQFAPPAPVVTTAPAAAVVTAQSSATIETSTPAELEGIEQSRRRWLRNACYAFGGLTAMTSLGAVWTESMGLQVRRVTLQCPRLPAAFRGYRLVQISDVHSGPYMGLRTMLAAREAAEALKPDLIVFTGDQVDSHWNQLPPFLEAFNGLHGPDGVYAILGNHDYLGDADRVREGLEAGGFPVLVNQHVRIGRGGQSIVLAGLDDLWHGNLNVAQAFDGTAPTDFRLTLMHNPNSFLPVAAAGADLMLAGHTHGGQINMIADCLSPARLMSPYVQGLFKHDTAQMFVNVGVGFVGIPVRIGVPAEIIEFTLV